MTINEFHESHIKEVVVSLFISELNLEPSEVTRKIGINADHSARRGEERKNIIGKILTPHKEGFWSITSRGKVNSKDINDHFRFLFDLLLPHKEVIQTFSNQYEVFFDVLWKSTYLYAGTGPLLDKESCAGIAKLNASLGFDIYQDDEDD